MSGKQKFQQIDHQNYEVNHVNSQKKDREQSIQIIFYLFLFVSILSNYDTGVVPVSISKIQEELKISYGQIAQLGVLSNLGICFTTIIISQILKRYNAKNVLSTAAFFNSIFCIILSFSPYIEQMYLCRYLMGIGQAFWIIYAPLWITKFSPLDRQATWLGVQQGISPLGIVIGYVCTGIIIQNIDWIHSWRISMMIQAVLVIPASFIILNYKNSETDILYYEKLEIQKKNMNDQLQSNDVIEVNNYESIFETFNDASQVMGKSVFMYNSLSMTMTFFISTAVQFWGTQFLIVVFKMNPNGAMLLFASVLVTAPLVGVLLGGYIIDKQIGGFKGSNMKNAIKHAVSYYLWGIISFKFKRYIRQFETFCLFLWFGVCFGASSIPATVGITISCLESKQQAIGQSITQLFINFGAYYLAPVFAAFVMAQFDDQTEGLIWGFRAALMFSALGLIFIIISYLQFDKYKEDNKTLFDHMDKQSDNQRLSNQENNKQGYTTFDE